MSSSSKTAKERSLEEEPFCLKELYILEQSSFRRRVASLSACFIKVLPCAMGACFPSGPEEENQLSACGAEAPAGSEAQ